MDSKTSFWAWDISKIFYTFNSIEWILDLTVPQHGVSPPFNSIEWILGLSLLLNFLEGVIKLSIPLNGFGLSRYLSIVTVAISALSIPLNGFLQGEEITMPKCPNSLLSIPLNGFWIPVKEICRDSSNYFQFH